MPFHPTAAEIAALVDTAARANAAFMNGDPALSFAINPQSEDFSIMTPFGGVTTGGIDTAPDRMQAMAQTFTSATTSFEVLATYAAADLVVIAAIERQRGLVGGLAEQDWSLRVTLVFRRKGAGWVLVHRHADPLVKGISLGQLATLARGDVSG